jgi:hypothetical protein
MVSHFDGAFSVVIRRNQDQLADEFKFSRSRLRLCACRMQASTRGRRGAGLDFDLQAGYRLGNTGTAVKVKHGDAGHIHWSNFVVLDQTTQPYLVRLPACRMSHHPALDYSPTPPCYIRAFLLFSPAERGWLDTATTRSTHDPSTDADPLLTRPCRIDAGRLFEQANCA